MLVVACYIVQPAFKNEVTPFGDGDYPSVLPEQSFNFSIALVRFGFMYSLLTWRTVIFILFWFLLYLKSLFFFFQLIFTDSYCCYYSFLNCSNSFVYHDYMQYANVLYGRSIIKNGNYPHGSYEQVQVKILRNWICLHWGHSSMNVCIYVWFLLKIRVDCYTCLPYRDLEHLFQLYSEQVERPDVPWNSSLLGEIPLPWHSVLHQVNSL